MTKEWNCCAAGTSRKSATQPFTSVPVVASVFVTTRSAALPATSAGVTAVRDVLELTTTPVAGWPPIVTAAPVPKSVPETVMVLPPPASPEAKLTEKGSRCENSEVLPAGSVAVALTCSPAEIPMGTVTSTTPVPLPSVVTTPEPRYFAPSRKSFGNFTQAGLEKKSRS